MPTNTPLVVASKGSRIVPTLITLALLLLVPALPAAAQPGFTLEVFGGFYDPDSVDDNSQIAGGRVGYRNSDTFGIVLSLGVIDLEDDILDIEDDDVQYGLFLTDLSFQWFPGGSNFYLFAGPGYSDVELEIDLPGNDNDINESTNSWTANAGLGYMWTFGDTFFLRPEAKARWFEGQEFEGDDVDTYDGLDTEYTLAFGWRF